MKKFYTVAFLALGVILSSSAQEDYELKVLTFEGEKWSALIDNAQYGGPLLYGEGSGAFTEEEAYKWYDEGNTELTSMLNYNYGAWCYWNGGVAVSNYYTPYEDGDYTTQLGIDYNKDGNHGYDNSSNFAVCFGYNDVLTNYGTDCRPVFTFGDGQEHVIDHLYVNTTAYFLHSVILGDGFQVHPTLSENTNAYLLAQGYDNNGEIIDTLSFAVIDKGTITREWTKFDLSSLGEIAMLKLDWKVSDDLVGQYGIICPAYIAIDNVAVRMPKADGVATVAANDANATVVAIYDANGQQLTEMQSGLNIVKMSDGTVRKLFK
ncbi:MAG: DUF4465 domain-containing protein [Prevotella sp.]|nr:DUF4465 domain-containing protein [Prevotella sp.]